MAFLRGRGLISSPETPSPLLCRLLQELSLLFHAEVLRRLGPTSLTMLAQVGRPCLAAVLASGLPRLPTGVTVRLELRAFCTSIERLAWAKASGCRWDERTCQLIAYGGHLETLRWAREHGCQWDRLTCRYAAQGGHLEVLQWARARGCPWRESDMVAYAAEGGQLVVLKWLRELGCPWNQWTCPSAAAGGHPEVLKWAREHGCQWDERTCNAAARNGHLAVLRWAWEHGCEWNEAHVRDLAAEGRRVDVGVAGRTWPLRWHSTRAKIHPSV